MKKYIDLHSHPFKEYFESPEKMIEKSHKLGIDTLFVVGTSLQDSIEVKSIAAKFDYTFPIIGIHPNEAKNKKDLIALRSLVDKSVIGIGEIGFDFHYDDSPSEQEQEVFFRYQIELALEFDIPVIIHMRESVEKTFGVLKEYKEQNNNFKIIIHSYSAGPEWVEKFLSIGAYFSFSGVITFKNAQNVRDAAILVPINKIFYETDTPYLAPVPFRGKMNLPYYAIYTAKLIAELKGISVEELNQQVNINVNNVFNITRFKNE